MRRLSAFHSVYICKETRILLFLVCAFAVEQMRWSYIQNKEQNICQNFTKTFVRVFSEILNTVVKIEDVHVPKSETGITKATIKS